MTVLSVGDRVEPFKGLNQFGQSVAVGGSHPWLLFFYPFAFTGVCSSELRALEAKKRSFRSLGYRIAAISCDSMFALRVFADGERFTYDMISDHWPHGDIARRFGVFDEARGCALRGSFLLDRDGVIRWTTMQQLGTPRDVAAHLAAAQEFAYA